MHRDPCSVNGWAIELPAFQKQFKTVQLKISSRMISEGEYVILKKENVIKAVEVRKGR